MSETQNTNTNTNTNPEVMNEIPNISYEGLYNCDFVVRYYDIEYELLEKLRERQKKTDAEEKNTENTILETNPSVPKKKEYYYTNSDVTDICNKLYRDELLSVFYADSIEDDNIDIQMRVLLVLMTTNLGFRSIVDDMINILLKMGDTPNEEEKNELKKRSKMIIFSTLFSHQLFYITHQCIIQMLRTHTIDSILINALRSKTVDMFNEDGTSKNKLHETTTEDKPNIVETVIQNTVIQNTASEPKLKEPTDSEVNPNSQTQELPTNVKLKKPRVKKSEPTDVDSNVDKPKSKQKKVKQNTEL